jgi:hypothetical protein
MQAHQEAFDTPAASSSQNEAASGSSSKRNHGSGSPSIPSDLGQVLLSQMEKGFKRREAPAFVEHIFEKYKSPGTPGISEKAKLSAALKDLGLNVSSTP